MANNRRRTVGGSGAGGVLGGMLGILLGGAIGGAKFLWPGSPKDLAEQFDHVFGLFGLIIGAILGGVLGAVAGAMMGAASATAKSEGPQSEKLGNLAQTDTTSSARSPDEEISDLKQRLAELEKINERKLK